MLLGGPHILFLSLLCARAVNHLLLTAVNRRSEPALVLKVHNVQRRSDAWPAGRHCGLCVGFKPGGGKRCGGTARSQNHKNITEILGRPPPPPSQ